MTTSGEKIWVPQPPHVIVVVHAHGHQAYKYGPNRNVFQFNKNLFTQRKTIQHHCI